MDIRKSDPVFQYLEKIHLRFEAINKQLVLPDFANQINKFRDLSREIHSLKLFEDKYHEYSRIIGHIEEAMIFQENAEDKELVQLAKQELETLQKSRSCIIKEIEFMLISDEIEDNRNVFLEIRAGAGGNEASLFASDLIRMYSRLAEKLKWKMEFISTTYSGIGGIKEIVIYIRGAEVFKNLRFERGVHRVQRVPVTESSGRIHTSTVTVAVLPEAEDIETQIDPKDIRIDTYAASGPGGQHVNKTESAIRISHFPTGIVVTCQDEKSQHKNKEKALKVLQARLLEHERIKQKETLDQTRKSQVGSAERSEKIRTYNFPQNRVTDHRVPSKNFNIEFILNGELMDLIEQLNQIRRKTLIDEKINFQIN